MAVTKKKPSTGTTTVRDDATPGLPSGSAPRPPVGFTPAKGRMSGALATKQQERDAPDVAREISSSPTYTTDFTPRAPDAGTTATQLKVARAWSDEEAAAEAWLAYVRTQRDVAWKAALTSTLALKPEFDLALKHDPSLATKYPQTQAFLGVWKVAAKRAAATRAKKKKAAKPTA